MTNILILAEHTETELEAATLATIGAAQKIGGEIDLLCCGAVASASAEVATAAEGVRAVLYADGVEYDNALAEPIAWLIKDLAAEYDYVLAPATTLGKDIMPRAAALCDVQQVSDIISVEAPTVFKRPIYAGNAIETVESKQAKHFVTIRPTAFDKVAATGGSAELKKVENKGAYEKARFVELQATESERPELTAASIVVSGGRGVASGENFEKVIEPLADKLGAAIGASRAAVDAGYVPNDYQVGQTGKVVAPDLYVAVGISGAIQHLAGMKESKVIVAINKDENAPIFEVADYGLVADLFDAVPELVEKL
jgi:electron transfer flavoprotein alpha subunit